MKSKLLFFAVSLSLSFNVALAGGPIQNIRPSVALGLRNSGKAILIDVRERDEIKDGLVSEARWVPLSGLKEDSASINKKIELLDKNQELLIYCRSGKRAVKAAIILQKRGFKVRNLGGFLDLKAAGFPAVIPNSGSDP